ncbi:hypothetical protein NC651_030395 [Populus alba x Populus x berolinensis]|nr:hypothetical protein NC651_030395 [Populus alba x Populus x berolinensis]
MPDFFDLKPNDMTKLPTWVRFPNLPLWCRTPLFLSKLASVIGKPIHCDDSTANMTRLSYARVLIKVVLPNGSNLAQQVLYESLPCFCKSCHILRHTELACRKGTKPKRKTRPQDIHEDFGSPSMDTEAVEKQQPYSQGPPVDTHVDPMTTEVATSETRNHSSPKRKRTKCADPKPVSNSSKEKEALPVKRQYLTRRKASKIEAQPSSGKLGKSKDPVLLHSSSDDMTPSLMM